MKLKDIINNWELYREKVSQTANNLDWLNRSKEIIEIYKQYAI
jgi:hypothetical protein